MTGVAMVDKKQSNPGNNHSLSFCPRNKGCKHVKTMKDMMH